MIKKYLLSFNDDNHDLKYWFDKKCLGYDIEDIVAEVYAQGQKDKDQDVFIKSTALYIFDFELEEDDEEILDDYLSFAGDIDNEELWNALVNEEYKKAVKIVKKITKKA